jgi:translation initiation factor IF-2
LAKNLKLNIKNLQIAKTLKNLEKKGSSTPKNPKKKAKKEEEIKEEKPQIKARILPSKIEEKKEKEIQAKKEKALEEEKQKEIKNEIKKQKKPVKEPLRPVIIKEPKFRKPKEENVEKEETQTEPDVKLEEKKETKSDIKLKPKETSDFSKNEDEKIDDKKKSFRSHKDFKAAKKPEVFKSFDSQDRLGLRKGDEGGWRRRRFKNKKQKVEIPVIRPKELSVKLPITIKDLASLMKLKASELIQKLFLQGVIVTINDYLEDETTVGLLGQEFDCDISIDTTEEKRIQISNESILQEINSTEEKDLTTRPVVITFMGHVDHGKTSIIDAIRSSNIASSESGDITQHIGAFSAKTKHGMITILDTPGHAAFSEMRSRGANVTDLVILVVAGDEGMKDQTIEAMNQAKEAKVPILVAINKSDKPGFDADKIYRELADHDLLPEAWGGSTITVNCSAKTNDGIDNLLEMISLQAELLELKANINARARGTVLESQMHTGLGAAATVLVQNGTLKQGDAIVFGYEWGRVKTIHDQYGKLVDNAPPSTPVKITGLSNLAEAGCEFFVVANEKEAKDLAAKRREKMQLTELNKKKTFTLDNFAKKEVKIFRIILRADVQGSLEALKTALLNIKTDKVDLIIVSSEVGAISESDARLAYASGATILGFHTKIESHSESLIKHLKVIVLEHDIIYHAIDEVKELMRSTLDKIEEEVDIGKAKVIATFKSSQLGLIAGCLVEDGVIKRNSNVRVIRNDEIIFKTKVNSLKRVKEDVKEVKSSQECGILLDKFTDIQIGDIYQAYDINYLEQEL